MTKDKYELETTINHKSLNKPKTIILKDTDLLMVKAEIKPTVELMCYENGITDSVLVDLVITKNGKYFDNDEGEFNIVDGFIV